MTRTENRSSVEHSVIGNCTLYCGDCMDVLPSIDNIDVVVTDPPYEETALAWDKVTDGWQNAIEANCVWVFGSYRSLSQLDMTEWTFAQDVIWEKHNGSGCHNDRFRKVHEIALQFYKGPWAEIYKKPVFTMDAKKRTIIKKNGPSHFRPIEGETIYKVEDGGPRLQRSVIHARSCHGHAVHKTQKPLEILKPLIEYSCPPDGTVLDPFMGSGSTGVACVAAGPSFIGIEKDPDIFEIACKRIKEAIEHGNCTDILPSSDETSLLDLMGASA